MTTLADAFACYPDTDKNSIHSYAQVYEELFAPYRERAIALLEVGVRHGGSLRAWRDWFSRAMIWGVDNHSEIGFVPPPDGPRIQVLRADSTKPESFDALGLPFFDIIIDDGCHHPMVQVATWARLYPYVRGGGLYVIEDVEGIVPAQLIQSLFGGEIIDRRLVKDRHDDILLVWRKPLWEATTPYLAGEAGIRKA